MVALLVLLAGSVPSGVGTVDLPESSTAEVYAYGHRLLPPFVFAEEYGVLTLNGFPFVPLGNIAPSKATTADSSLLASRLASKQGFRSEKRMLRKRAAEAMSAATTKSEALEAARAVYSASPVVTDVRFTVTISKSLSLEAVGGVVAIGAQP